MKNVNFFKGFIYNLSDPCRTFMELDKFVEDHKDAIFWYGHIGIPDDEIYKVILEQEQDLAENADFFSDAIDVFDMFRRREMVSKSLQDHEESIDYFKEKVAPYL